MELGSNKEIQCENENEGKSVIDRTHSLSSSAGPLFFLKSGERCCIFTPFFTCPFILCTSALSVLVLVSWLDPRYAPVIAIKSDKWKKKERKGKEDSFAPEL